MAGVNSVIVNTGGIEMSELALDTAIAPTQGRLYRIQSVLDGNFLQAGQAGLAGDPLRTSIIISALDLNEKSQEFRAEADDYGWKFTNNGTGHVLANHGHQYAILYSYASAEWSKWNTFHFGNDEIQIRIIQTGINSLVINTGGLGSTLGLARLDQRGANTKWKLIFADSPPPQYVID